MSFILNALRKSEQQRVQGQPETLEKSILEKNEPQQKKISFWLIVLIIMNMIFLGFIIWSFTKEDNLEMTEKVEKTIQATEKPVATDKKVEQISVPVHVKTKKPQQQTSIADQIKIQKSKVILVNTKPGKTKLAIKADKITQKQKNPPAAIKKLVKAVESIKSNNSEKKVKTGDIPFLKELSYDFIRKVPKFDINVFVYTENKNDRFIMLQTNKYVIEEEILPGMTLKEIREESIVVEYNAKVFQIKRK